MSSAPRKTKHAATLADVGREAGVSAMAASAVLNGAKTSSRIAPETRQRILDAARKLHYRPNAAARALADRRMNTLGVAVVMDGDELSQYFLEIFNGVVAGAAHANQNTTVFALKDWGQDTARIPQICDGRIDGLLLIAPKVHTEHLSAIPDHTPMVAIHANIEIPNVINLESDEQAGAYEMVKHLIAQGHRRILHLSGPHDMIGAQRRIEGYERAHTTAKLKFDPEWIVESTYDTPTGRSTLEAWLDAHRGELLPDAIFCANDGIAIGAIEALSARGYRVPDEISVVGFDDTLAARSINPPLTTVRQPLRAMGQHAMEVLVARVEAKLRDDLYRSPKSIVFPTEVIQRQSLGPVRKNRVVIR